MCMFEGIGNTTTKEDAGRGSSSVISAVLTTSTVCLNIQFIVSLSPIYLQRRLHLLGECVEE